MITRLFRFVGSIICSNELLIVKRQKLKVETSLRFHKLMASCDDAAHHVLPVAEAVTCASKTRQIRNGSRFEIVQEGAVMNLVHGPSTKSPQHSRCWSPSPRFRHSHHKHHIILNKYNSRYQHSSRRASNEEFTQLLGHRYTQVVAAHEIYS
jgi:hypothetical protein